MASLAIDPAYRRVTVREFLDMDLGDAKAELVDGMIFMMASGSPRHAAIDANLIAARCLASMPLCSSIPTTNG